MVRSEETNGSVTGAALSALAALLRHGEFDPRETGQADQGGPGGRGRAGSAEALSELVDVVSGCRFEFTDARRDEVTACPNAH